MDRLIVPDTYAAWSKNKSTRYNSTSGGAFSELVKIILADNGLVAGAKYNCENKVEHTIIDSYNDIEQIRQSKYLSSSIGDTYKTVKSQLISGKYVAFCGSPCQVAGLYSYLGENYENLFTIDFICRGMNSPKAFRSWLDEIEKKQGSKVKKIWFKYKEGGWKSSPRRTRLDFCDGTYRVFDGKENLYMHGYLTTNLYMRPCCGKCNFKGIPRKSDITLADFWGIENELDDDKGISMILVNSEKGRKIFERAKDNMVVYKKDFNTIFSGNPMFDSSAIVPKRGQDFLADLDKMSFSKAIKKYSLVLKYDKVANKIRTCIFR